MAPFDYVSDLGLNLHHVLNAAAFASRGETAGRAQAQGLPAELALRGRPEFGPAVEYYRQRFQGRDLLRAPELEELKSFLVTGCGATPPGWQEVFEPVRPRYADTDWPEHDEINRAWSAQVTQRLELLLPDVLDELQRLFRDRLPDDGPLRVDTVWVGHWTPAYTTLGPTHLTCSTTHRESQDWAAVEVVLHEACHSLATPLRRAIRDRVDPSSGRLGDLWHVVLFHQTGETVRRALAGLGVDYRPYLDATGLFDRAWPHLRQPVTDAWAGYLDGSVDWADACDRLAANVTT